MKPDIYYRLRTDAEGAKSHSILIELSDAHFAAFMSMLIAGAQAEPTQLFGPRATLESLRTGRIHIAELVNEFAALTEKMKAA